MKEDWLHKIHDRMADFEMDEPDGLWGSHRGEKFPGSGAERQAGASGAVEVAAVDKCRRDTSCRDVGLFIFHHSIG